MKVDALSSLSLIILMVSVDIRRRRNGTSSLWLFLQPLRLSPSRVHCATTCSQSPPPHEHQDHVSSCNIMYITCLIYFIVYYHPRPTCIQALQQDLHSCNVLTEPCHCVKDRKNLRRRILMIIKKLWNKS